MYCGNCGNVVNDDAYVCAHCGYVLREQAPKLITPPDSSDLGIALLGFLNPLAGLLIWILYKNYKPLLAKSAIKGALIGFVVSVVVSVLFGILIVGLGVLGSMMSTPTYYYY